MHDLDDTARHVMDERNPALTAPFREIVAFVADNPDLAVRFPGASAPTFGTRGYLERLADRYIKGMESQPLPQPQTIPDPALSVVMHYGYRVSTDELHTQIDGHRWAMVAENVVGDLLERYIHQELDDDDWVWCAGSVVRHIDFIRRGRAVGTRWESLQVKNRDNSENSSSSRVRVGTTIQKWHRTVSRTGQTRWEQFPVGSTDVVLNEQGFQRFIVEYIGRLNESS